MQNPFKYGCIVTGADFCDRPELINQLRQNIKAGQNIVVYGERRIGKSSAVYQAVLKEKPRKPLLIDLMGIKSVDGLVKRILKALVAHEKKRGFVATILKKFASMRPTMSLDPVTSMPTISFDASVSLSAESIGEAIDLIKNEYGEKKVVVIMDEFQDILDLHDSKEALAILRANIQYQDKLPYVFVGSIRGKMNSIFADSQSPFFKAAIPIEVNPIDNKRFATFIEEKMKKGKRIIGQQSIDTIFDIANNIPGDIQQMCQALWSVSQEGDQIDSDKTKEALQLIFSRERYAYEDCVRLLTKFQHKSLVGIANEGGENIFSNKFMKATGFTNASTLRKCIQRLVALNILFDYKGEYRFINPFFRAWLLTTA